MSIEKKSLLVWYLLEHSKKYTDIKTFLIALLENDSIIYHKHEKSVMKCIVSNWMSIGDKMMKLAKKKHEFLRVIFVLCRMISDQESLKFMYDLVQC